MSENPWGLPLDELEAGLEAARDDVEFLRAKRIFVSGGTGFLGSWLVSSLLYCEARLGLGMRLLLLTRNPAGLRALELAHPGVTVVQGDVRALSNVGAIDVVVHGAASSSAPWGVGDGEPRAMADTIYRGTESVLQLAANNSARVLFLSSGAVYGPQTAPVDESCTTAPNPLQPGSAYAQAKRLAETLCACASAVGDVEAVIARLFAFVGPRLPLRAHYAAGNFLSDALEGRAIRVNGDGRPMRSYLYAGDLPEWCWAILARGIAGQAYNVGSSEPVSIAELAKRVARLCEPELDVEVLGRPSLGPAPWYVPVTERARMQLGLVPRSDLDKALRKSLNWLRSSSHD